MNVVVDDQDHTADWLRRGRVVAAVTSLEKPVAGYRRIKIGGASLSCNGEPRPHGPLFSEEAHPGID